jgi:hypothetical protein
MKRIKYILIGILMVTFAGNVSAQENNHQQSNTTETSEKEEREQ